MFIRLFSEPCRSQSTVWIANEDKETHLLALLDDTVPQVLPARREVFESVSHDLLYRLLGARGRSGRPE